MKFNLDEKYIKDLEFFINSAESKRTENVDEEYPNESMHLNFYLNHSKEELKNYIYNYINNNKVKDDNDFFYMINCIVKYMSSYSDSHTVISKKDDVSFPIKFKIVGNNIYIDNCNEKRFIKQKIKAINGVDINIIINEIEKCTSYATKGWLLSNIERFLNNKNKLLSLPSINSNISEIEFQTDNDVIKYSINNNYDNVLFDVNEQIIIKDNTLIFKYPRCRMQYEPDIKKIDEIIKNNNINNFVLDLRENSGGNSEIIMDLIEYLSNSNLNLTTLVDKHVFSSGHFAVYHMKRIGSKIVGEEIGTPLNYFGYSTSNLEMPNTKINFHFAKVYWHEDNGKLRGIYTKEELNKKTKEFFKPRYLMLDEYIELTEEEYLTSSEDVILDKCCKLKKNIYK